MVRTPIIASTTDNSVYMLRDLFGRFGLRHIFYFACFALLAFRQNKKRHICANVIGKTRSKILLKTIDIFNNRVYNTYMKSSDIIKILKNDGWIIHNIRGSHHQLKHPVKIGKVTVPHPKSDIPIGTLKSIFKQAQINMEDIK